MKGKRRCVRAPRAAARSMGGFSLIELLVVVVIIGLLAALVAPRVIENLGTSKVQTTRAQLLLLENAVQQFRIDMQRAPTKEEGLGVLLRKPSGPDGERWQGPYLERDELPVDGWGKGFEYAFDENGRFVIRSLGADGQAGGEGEASDLDNRSL